MKQVTGSVGGPVVLRLYAPWSYLNFDTKNTAYIFG